MANDGWLAPAVIEHAADAIVFADVDGVIRMWNAAATKLFGFGPDETIGRGMDMIIPEHLREAHWKGFHNAMASGETRLGGQATLTRGLHKSGKRLYVEMSFAVVRDASDAVVGSVAVARDATARYEEERARRQAAARAPGSSTGP
jgi:PAS domain S-box-containing protein